VLALGKSVEKIENIALARIFIPQAIPFTVTSKA